MTREFMGIAVEGDLVDQYSRREYTPRPIEELYPYFKEAFAQGVKAATWYQYTPYFNDGEPCEFNVYDLSVTSSDEVAENWLEGHFYEDRLVEVSKEKYDDEYWAAKNSRHRYYLPYEIVGDKYFKRYEEGTYDYIPGFGHPDGINDVDIPVHMLEFEDALRSKFGDHTRIVITANRVVQFDYEHE